jgi:hypothetical protein
MRVAAAPTREGKKRKNTLADYHRWGEKKPVSLLNYHTGCVGKTKMLKYKISGVSPIARRH